MEQGNKIVADNIVALRREARMTQLELAEKLNYSDKAVSKWERGESIPDVFTLKEVADTFGVTVDYLLEQDHSHAKLQQRVLTRRQRRNRLLIAAMSAVLVWLIATLVFVNLNYLSDTGRHWLTFVCAVPVSMIVLLVFNSIWGKRRFNFLLVSLLIWSTLAMLYLALLPYNLWLIFAVGAPAQVIVLLWAGLRTK